MDGMEQSTEAAVKPSEYLTFRLGKEEYGIDILTVQEIRGYDAVTRVTGAPEFLKGVINLRGVIAPIVDLRLKFHLGDIKYDEFTVVIILNVAGRIVGVVVDSVSDVLELTREQIRVAPEFNSLLDASYITGLGTAGTEERARMLILLDIEKLMTSPEMGIVAEEEARAA
jgi:purine-binding chemotaxis protein CheW